MSINLLGNVSELQSSRVPFNIALAVTGVSGQSRHSLSEQAGLRQFLVGRAYASIVSDSLRVQVTGSVTSTRSIDVHVCIIPANFPSFPNTAAGVTSVPGSAFVQHSVVASGQSAVLSFPDGVTGQLKPTPVWGELPSVVTWHEILGGTQTSTATIKISGLLEVGGIGFVQTW